jgi:hypothetical protein
MLAFVAPDQDTILSLETEVRRLIAWQSIVTDKDELNLDGNQNREALSHVNRCNDTVELRLKETYCWLIVPFIDQFGDMKSIQWEVSSISGGSDPIVTKAAKKMIQEEQVITKWAPALLQMSLDDLLWKDSDDISIKKLWEYLSTYCYLPRLANYGVLEDAIINGLPSTEFFALAAGFSNGRYVDLKFNKAVFSVNQSDLLVKTNVAMKQLVTEKPPVDPAPPAPDGGEGGSSGTSEGSNGENGGGVGPTPPPKPINKHFYMSAKLDNVRINRDVNTYVQEIIQHLTAVTGAEIELRLEVEVNAPNGIPNNTVRTVSENCRTLKVKDFGFDS